MFPSPSRSKKNFKKRFVKQFDDIHHQGKARYDSVEDIDKSEEADWNMKLANNPTQRIFKLHEKLKDSK